MSYKEGNHDPVFIVNNDDDEIDSLVNIMPPPFGGTIFVIDKAAVIW